MHPYRDILSKKFKEEYEKLNTEQRKAVDSIEGPVMVIAGPGTGKTQILAARIGKILLETDVSPQNILCLTFTDAGVVAMRRRLVQFIGADAYRVNIFTFHAFCNEVIQDNISLFDKNSLNPVSELQRIQLMKELIDNFPKDHPLKRYRGDVYCEIYNLTRLFSAMKNEGWSPLYINQKIDEYLKDIPARKKFIYQSTRPGYRKGDLKVKAIEEEKTKMEKLRAAVKEFDNFQALMSKHSLYDFDDMINWVIRVFEENKNLLANYQEKYQYILVDEFQDTSGTQNKIVQLLISYWESPNIFVVGDDDQSIFRFQGANVENMANFAGNYAGLLKVVLKNNYRSAQPILDISRTLIESNNERLINKLPGLSKDLVASRITLKETLHHPVIREYQTIKDEMTDITLHVEKLVAEGVEPGRVAIIYRENKYGEELLKYFRLKNIPAFSRRSINILENAFAKKIIQLLRYIACEHDTPYGGDGLLFEILHFDFYGAPPIEIAKLTVEVNRKQSDGELTSIRRWLYEKSRRVPTTLFDKGPDENLKKVSTIIEKLIADVSNVTLQTLFENVINEGGILKYIMQSSDKVYYLQILTALFDFIKDETARNPLLTVQGLVDIIDLMQNEGIPLPLVQISGTDTGVNLLTVHGAKGLEFEYVFFAGCNAHFWEKKKVGNKGFSLPDTVFSSLPACDPDEELRRLFYVALTRAEKYLFISYFNYKADNREAEPTMFIEEILEYHDLTKEKVTVPEDRSFQFEILQFTTQKPEIEKAEEDLVTALLEKFVMNVSALNNYLCCPLQFYFRNLIRIPSGKSEALQFGSAIHHAVKMLFEKMQKHDQQLFNKQELFEDFKWFMSRNRESFTREGFERKMEYGEKILDEYYEQYASAWNKIVKVELNLKTVYRGIPIKGRIDKVEYTGTNVNVVDYKTGDAISKWTKEKLWRPNDKNPLGGDYWRQAVFYKILIDNADNKWKVVSTTFDFIEPDKEKQYYTEKIVIEPEDVETVSQQITDTWNKIQVRDFYTGCGKQDCQWCNFVKDNKLAVSLHEVVEEDDV